MTDENVKEENYLPELVIITGMSGAGRTEAMHVFEDLGYYCVDNLPSQLISSVLELQSNIENARNVAIVCDSRNGVFFNALTTEIEQARNHDKDIRVIFLDSNDEKLIARYKSSRRRHPLCDDGSTIADGIRRERVLMQPIKDMADLTIDTSEMLPQDFRSKLREIFEAGSDSRGLSVSVYSFGFKHAPASDADLVIDVRFLPNPYWVEELKSLTGLDAAVKDYVMLRDETVLFQKKWRELLDVLMPGYVKEGKQQLCIAIGCTGGQHRSVAIAESTGDYLKNKGYRVSVAHRDLTKR
jgi:RNase adapter protein RapZ